MVAAAVVLLPDSRSSYGETVTGFASRLLFFLLNVGVLYMAFDSKINKVYASVERRKPCIERKKRKKK